MPKNKKNKTFCDADLSKMNVYNQKQHIQSCIQCQNRTKNKLKDSSIKSFYTAQPKHQESMEEVSSSASTSNIASTSNTDSDIDFSNIEGDLMEEDNLTTNSEHDQQEHHLEQQQGQEQYHQQQEQQPEQQEEQQQQPQQEEQHPQQELEQQQQQHVADEQQLEMQRDQADQNDILVTNEYFDDSVSCVRVRSVCMGESNCSFVKCKGYRIMTMHINDIYTKFPFALVPLHDFVFENGCLHQSTCVDKNYRLHSPSDDDPLCNKDCYDLQFTHAVKKIVSYVDDDNLYKKPINNVYLSHHQQVLRFQNIQEQLKKSRLQVLTQSHIIRRLNKVLQFHQRFLHFIQTNRIHRLHDIVEVALRQKKNIRFIVQRLQDALDGVYNPHYKQDDKDLAFIIYQFGGPALLEIVHRAIKLPSCSTALKILKGSRTINTAVDVTLEELAENIQVKADAPAYGHMLKMDEHYVDKRVRWSPQDNKCYGFCYDHTHDKKLTFDTWDDVMKLKEYINNDIIHAPKECMVMSTASNSLETNVQPVLI